MDNTPAPSTAELREKAKRRADLIMEVRVKRKSLTEAADELEVSRKTFYEWEERGLTAMVEALMDREPGRPAKPRPDPERLRLEKQVQEQQKEIEQLRLMARIRDILDPLRQPLPDPDLVRPTATKKKP